MTITRKPRRPAGARTTRTDGAEAFIQAAQHLPAAEEEEPAASAAPASDPAPALESALAPAPERKAVKKDKKHKDKKKKAKKKEAVLIRFDDGQLDRIDGVAARLGLSRAAWVRMVVAKALPDA